MAQPSSRRFASSSCKIDFFLLRKAYEQAEEEEEVPHRSEATADVRLARSVPRNFRHHRRPRRDTGRCARTRAGASPRLSRRLLFRRRLSARTLGEKSFARREGERKREREREERTRAPRNRTLCRDHLCIPLGTYPYRVLYKGKIRG